MTKYACFLRGINVGGRIVRMGDLKACFEALGFSDIKTWLQTGNVTFESNETDTKLLKQQIESALTKTFVYPAKAQIFMLKQLADIVKACPFGEPQKDTHSYVVFLENGLEKELFAVDPHLDPAIEEIQLGKGVIYWKVQKGMTLKSQFAKLLTKAKYKDFNTNRNTNTLRKIIQ